MRHSTFRGVIWAGLTAGVATAALAAPTILGAGATFPYPVYSQWAHKYQEITAVQVNYQSIGSGGGIQQIKAGTVDFGASDAPLTKAELDSFGLIQFPLVIGGVVPVVNLVGIAAGTVRLNGKVLADIYLGKVTKWNDPAVVRLNPGVNLPAQTITVVRRADGSGTTWVFTTYLAKVSDEWRGKVGAGKAVAWPVGVGGKGNEGVAAYVQRVPGAVGYVEFAYALQNRMNYILMENRDGKFVAPAIETFQAAATNAQWNAKDGFFTVLVDQAGADSWPITGASFIIIRRQQRDGEAAGRMLKFFDWCFTHGADIAVSLHYVPMPKVVADQVRSAWAAEVTTGGRPVWK